MKEIKSIGVSSATKIYGISMAIMGMILGLVVTMVGLIAGGSDIPFFGTGLGIAGVIIFPILYGVIGLIFGALGAFIYNFIAKIGGGLEIEIVGKEELHRI